jgi:hypothetical protein
MQSLDHFIDFLHEKYIQLESLVKQRVGDENYNQCVMGLLATQYEHNYLNSIKVKKSKIHGNGVFATKDIQEGEVITYYPADIILYFKDGLIKHDGKFVGTIQDQPQGTIKGQGKPWISQGREIYPSLRFAVEHSKTTDEKYLDDDYIYQVDEHYTIMGYHEYIDNLSYVGHIINDAAKTNSTERADKVYDTVSKLRANCLSGNINGGVHVAILAKRNIKAGEELFINYGIPYWHMKNERDKLNNACI